MSTPQSPVPGRSSAPPLLFAAARALMLAAILFLPVAVLAGWLDRVAAPRHKAEADAARPAGAFDKVIAHVKSVPAAVDSVPLAAEATSEGHWRFVNQAGEIFTAGTPGEMRRAIPVLYPRARANVRPAIHVGPWTALTQRAAFKSLPAGADLFIVSGERAYRLVRGTDAAGERISAQVRPNVVTEITDRRAFDEAAWQLERPLARAGVRVLALEPGGPSTLHAWPRMEPSGKAMVDVIDPASLAAAMGALAGHTLLITGRVDRDQLYFQPNTGAERALSLKTVFRAANDADVNLIVLETASTPRQPGGRNWFWQRVDVRGLGDALHHASLADFLNVLSGGRRPFTAVALPFGDRTMLDLAVTDAASGGSLAGQAGEYLGQIVSDISGRVTIAGVQANLQSHARVRELERRLIPGIPSAAQLGYFILLFVGLVGTPVSGAWWSRIWPPEARDEYGARTGFRAAQAIRGLVFTLVFVPLTAPVAMPFNLAAQVRDAVTAPLRWWRFLTGRTAARQRNSVVAALQTQADNAPKPPSAPPVPREPRLVFPKFLSRTHEKGSA
jgi:hypothetical protein